MKIVHTEMGRFQKILERREAVLVHELQYRHGIAIEKIPGQGFTTAALELALSANGRSNQYASRRCYRRSSPIAVR